MKQILFKSGKHFTVSNEVADDLIEFKLKHTDAKNRIYTKTDLDKKVIIL